jgi:hypothetical protein
VRRTIIASCNAVAQWYRADGPDSLDDLVERQVFLAYRLLGYEPRNPNSRSGRARRA